MKQKMLIIALLFLGGFSCQAQTQSTGTKSCSVILLNNEWLIKSYDQKEAIKLSQTSKGLISVHETGDIKERTYKKGRIPFMIAILKKSDNTMSMFSDKAFNEMSITEVLKKCVTGDNIIILLKEDTGAPYSLPHHVIEVI